MAALAESEKGDEFPQLVGLLPPTQLSEHLLPPLKRAGVPFDEAWERALELVVWPGSLREAKEWRAMLASMRLVWQASYEDWPAEQAELAAAALPDTFDA
jgi:hypothetical protein